MSVHPAQPLLGRGLVRHVRLRPVRHAFAYPTFFLMLPLRSLRATPCAALRRNRRGLMSFHDADHGEGGPDALAWVEALLQREGIVDAQGEIWLQTYPRVPGYMFNPVSFWHCHRPDGSLAAIVVEVNNTFGERHCYLLCGPRLAYGRELAADKMLHVSPFCSIEGRYRFRFLRTSSSSVRPDRTVSRIEFDDAQGPLLQASISGHLEPLTLASASRGVVAIALTTLLVIVRIHWQALMLWRKRVPLFGKPAAPREFVSR